LSLALVLSPEEVDPVLPYQSAPLVIVTMEFVAFAASGEKASSSASARGFTAGRL
jgi:hypothetical protein